MRLRLLLLLPPLALAVPAPAAPMKPAYGRLCGGGAGGREDMPGKQPCPVACHAALCERQRKGR
ncbi:hypothetical protein [Sphingomonas hengshuiensis]|uniref:Uncharacterized protein n=1 Tax=Sphingomonas hengshuiensis TaxID=1609977 RepID=A0A7U4J801_9SPHN|nr:hypothetical protein [Sphingomonas hengshuiensis]AJP71812.1 hypothetical protein TS85_08485 [Sphingomonas hengshuiensis]